MHTLLFIIIFLLFIPFSAEAAMGRSIKTVIKKPVLRNNLDPNPVVTTRTNDMHEKFFSDLLKEKPYISYKHLASGLSLKHPADWEPYEFAKNRGFSLSQKDVEKIRTFVQVTIEPIADKKDKSLKEIDTWFMNKSTISNDNPLSDWYIPSFDLISSEDALLLGKPAKKYVYTGEVSSIKLKFVKYIASIDQHLYSVQYASQPESFDHDMPVFDKIFSTLKQTLMKAIEKPRGKTRQ